jgi:hypothetical protein
LQSDEGVLQKTNRLARGSVQAEFELVLMRGMKQPDDCPGIWRVAVKLLQGAHEEVEIVCRQFFEVFLPNFLEGDFTVAVVAAQAIPVELATLPIECAAGVRKRTLAQLKSVLTMFAAKFGEEKYLDEANTEACLALLKTRGTTPKTWNNYRADLHNLFEHAKSKSVGWIGMNPVSDIEKRKIDGRGMACILKYEQCTLLMTEVESFEKGCLVPYFALALFAGLRPGPDGELHKLLRSEQRADFVDLANGVIHIQPEVSKTRDYRQVKIRPNLAAWLKAFPLGPLPTNFDRNLKKLRKKHALGHDVLRHTFFSMHVGAFGSISEAALEGGNSEQVCKKHYLNLTNKADAAKFWEIQPASPQQGAKAA